MACARGLLFGLVSSPCSFGDFPTRDECDLVLWRSCTCLPLGIVGRSLEQKPILTKLLFELIVYFTF